MFEPRTPPKKRPNPYIQKLMEFSTFAFEAEAQAPGAVPSAPEPQFAGRWSNQLGGCTRLVLEIGCSNAFYLSEIAAKNPDVGFVGVDWKYKVIWKAAKNVARRKIKNLVLIRGVATATIRFFGRQELDEVWILFPDPWAKKSQLKNRIMREDFLVRIAELLKPAGKIQFKTDHPGYFQWVLALMGCAPPAEFDRLIDLYSAPEPAEKSRQAKQIKVRRVEGDELPTPSETCAKLFVVSDLRVDYWGSKLSSQIAEPQNLMTGHKTLFEKIFVSEGLPVYWIELTRKT